MSYTQYKAYYLCACECVLPQLAILLPRGCSVVRFLPDLSFVYNGSEMTQGEGFSHTSFASRLVAFSFCGFTYFQKQVCQLLTSASTVLSS